MHSTSKWNNSAACPSYINYCLKREAPIMLHCQLCWTCYIAVQTVIKIATMKNTDDFRYKEKNPPCATAKSTHFVVCKNEWNTKEDTGKSVKNALYILRHHLSDWSNVEQWKNWVRILSHCWVTLVLRHQAGRQAVSLSVENSNFVAISKVFWIDLNAYFYLTNTAHHHLGELRLVFELSCFTGLFYSFVVTCYYH